MDNKVIIKLLRKSGVGLRSVIEDELSALELRNDSFHEIGDTDLEILEMLLHHHVSVISDSDLESEEDVENKRCITIHSGMSDVHDKVLDLAIAVSKSAFSENRQPSPGLESRLLRLIQVSYPQAGRNSQLKIQDLCLQTFKAYSTEEHISDAGCPTSCLDLHLTMAIMYRILIAGPVIDCLWLDEIFFCTMKMIISEDEEVVGKLLSLVLPGLLKRTDEKDLEIKLLHLWTTAHRLYDTYGQKTYEAMNSSRLSGRPLMVLCGLADWFFPVDGKKLLNSLVINDIKFWLILQTGLFNSNPLSRKRASYILKRMLDIVEKSAIPMECCSRSNHVTSVPVFWWHNDYSKALGNIWQDYILILETLEEKQVHVIKPILPRLAALIAATHRLSPDREGGQMASNTPDRALFHTSWVCTLIERMACHESAFIRRAGITELLQIDLSKFPLLQQEGQQFMCGSLIAMLAESLVYYKPPDLPLGSCPPAGQLLVSFLQSCLTVLHKPRLQGDFLQHFVGEMVGRQWSGSALVFVSRGLSLLPRLPVCGPKLIQDIRSLLLAVLTNLEVHPRGAIQCFLATAVTKILDTDSTDPGVLLPLLSVVRPDECLSRGTTLWKQYTGWLQTTATTSPAWAAPKLHTFINDQLSLCLDPNKEGGTHSGPVEVGALIRLMLLAADAGLLTAGPRDAGPIVSILRPVTDILLTINSHAYMPAVKADRALHFLTTVLQEVQYGIVKDDSLVAQVHQIAAMCKDEILLFIIRRATSDIKELDDVSVLAAYTVAVRALQTAGLDIAACPHLTQGVQQLAAGWSTSDNMTQQPSLEKQMRRLAVVAVLGAMASGIRSCPPSEHTRSLREIFTKQCQGTQPDHQFSRPAEGSGDNVGHGNSTWGRVSATYIQGQYECLLLLLDTCTPTVQFSDLADRCQDALDVTSGPTIIPVLQCLGTFILKLETSMQRRLVDVIWRKVLEESRNTLFFWDCLDSFVEAVLVPELLLTTDEELSDCLSQIMSEFLRIGEEKQGLVNVLVSRMCLLIKNPDHQVPLLEKYCDFIISAISFGPIHDKNKRYCNEVMAFLTSLGDSLAINQLRDGNMRDDNVVRALLLSELSRLSVDNPEHVDLTYRLLSKMFRRLVELNQNKAYRGFNNSLPHRIKHRIIVAVLVLHPLVCKGDDTIEQLLELLVIEHQPSVRFMVEWLTVRVILQKPHILERIVKEISRKDERRMSYLCSLFTVATHAAKHIDSEKQEAAVLQVLPAVLPWCTMHHFNCRTFAQACIMVLWEVSRDRGLQRVLDTHSIVAQIVHFQMNNINHSMGTQKLLDNFFFHFDPVQDYSIETITWTLPWLVGVIEDEWIEPRVVARCDPSWDSAPRNLPLVNRRRVLNTCTPGTWKLKVIDGEDFQATDGNVQKKLIPWTCMLPEQNLEAELTDELAGRRGPGAGQLVLVTSLIDKVPNLGGLCRTSEIFGVAEFVIGNLKYVKLHEFETLSVTAHKWIPIKEVRPWMLKTYLLQMKERGFTLVGAEQTADSVSLCNYSFPDKTLLLLGNEKEGIPVELIQLLDVCVEIPQQGIVRSLNVHVSGALLVWEYTRQRLAMAGVPSVDVAS